MSNFAATPESGIATESRVKKPRMYKVLLHNDDYTTMEFVVEILVSFFDKNENEATAIMLDVHKKGYGVCGVYIYDVARTKVKQVTETARNSGFPLRCSYEEE